MGMFLEIFLQCGLPILLIIGAFFIGTLTENNHLKRLGASEASLAGIRVSTIDRAIDFSGAERGEIVVGECVIATDHFKSFIAKIVKLVGGELKIYRSLMERARRQALVRLMESAREKGYTSVCNIRLQTADVGGSAATARGATMVAVLASGTAYREETAGRP
ncbi:MAG: heavy metal-binding domain-containing protein [Planctomycetota bacterium]